MNSRMNRVGRLGLAACVLFLTGLTARAEVKVTVDHNDNDHATAESKFDHVPVPSKKNAATQAKFSIVDGNKDENGGELAVLHDGKTATEQDQPDANFFFDAEGGRFAIDLGSVIELKQIDSYSWHPNERAPQVYTLYAADGTETGFKAEPKDGTDPAKVGWKLLAKVDTHARSADGGQFAVDVTDTAGTLGKFRYLLFVVAKGTADNENGNTFFSEICVIDAADKEMLNAPADNANKPGVKQVVMEDGKYTAVIDTTETPGLTDWADGELSDMVVDWYPKLVKMLPSDGFEAPTHFSITFRKNKPGVADTTGTRINCAERFFKNEIKGQGKGAVLHEMVHVVQQYGYARRTNPHPGKNPGYFVEGLCDCIRWYDFEPQSHGSVITKNRLAAANYDGSYRITANFLHYVATAHDNNLLPELNAVMRQGNYTEEFWQAKTGKSLEDLNTEWKSDLAKQLGV